mgnify:CR=1 FL=1
MAKDYKRQIDLKLKEFFKRTKINNYDLEVGMAVGLFVDPLFYKIEHGDYLNAFFSTITYHLEHNMRGSVYPYVKKFYDGVIDFKDIDKLSEELIEIKEKLKFFEPDKIMWDNENLSLTPPWGNNNAKRITNLSNYFYTSNGGKDLFEIFFKAFESAKEIEENIIIQSI